jgi:hypothetical protein
MPDDDVTAQPAETGADSPDPSSTPSGSPSVTGGADDGPLGVVVGYDGSEHALQALHYAARAALREGERLTVVTAYTVPTMSYAEAALTPTVPAEVARLNAAREVLDEAREHLRDYPGELALDARWGDAAGVLVMLSGSWCPGGSRSR